jgi:hypothetical protein
MSWVSLLVIGFAAVVCGGLGVLLAIYKED